MPQEPLPSYAPKQRRPRPRPQPKTDSAQAPPAPPEADSPTRSAPPTVVPSFQPKSTRPHTDSSVPAFTPAGAPVARGMATPVTSSSQLGEDQYSAQQSSSDETSEPKARGGAAPRRRRRPGRVILLILLALLLAALLWAAFLYRQVSSHLGHTDALSGTPAGSATSYLIAGSDSRGDGAVKDDGTQGERTDSLMLVVKGANGISSVISLPRDTDVKIPGHGNNKLNAAFAFGGAPLLVQTVESLVGFKVDHFVLVRMGGVAAIVDAVGGVELCLDFDVNDPKSELHWQAGCHQADGKTALAFARMRYEDPRGDLGRQDRQRQVISKTLQKALSPQTILNPIAANNLAKAGASALVVDSDSSPIDIAQLALAYRSANKAGLSGIPPIASLNYRNGHGAAVLLDPELAPKFFGKAAAGTLTPQDFYQK